MTNFYIILFLLGIYFMLCFKVVPYLQAILKRLTAIEKKLNGETEDEDGEGEASGN